jgi:hypothetical protein
VDAVHAVGTAALFRRRSRRPAGAALALVARACPNTTCSSLVRWSRRMCVQAARRQRRTRAWRHVALAAGFVAGQARCSMPGRRSRSSGAPAGGETLLADVYAIWRRRRGGGRRRAFQIAEADLFPGVVPIGLRLASVVLLVTRGWTGRPPARACCLHGQLA